MKNRILLLLAVVAAGAAVGLAQQPKGAAANSQPVAKAAVSALQAGNAVDPDEAYKANCSRCHLAPRKFPEGKMATIMRRMRVRANLTDEEAEAILRYLTR